MRGSILFLVSLVCALESAPSSAEERDKERASQDKQSAEELDFRMRFGDTIRLKTGAGGFFTGRVENFDGDELRVDGRTFRLSEGDVRQIELKVDDSVGNGALIGAGIGAGLVLATCVAVGGECDEFMLFVGTAYAGAGAGLGTLVDALHQRHDVVYVAPGVASPRKLTVTPLFTSDKKGVLVSLTL